ncbi:hypothetical protein [Thermoleptolyngbya sp. M55_K2018_002]|uniref:hypothetical protein n=1 Tax=Thermoleptolyngbya sp. M55_K2018_002 TaxID=2747808 RepID=UPI0025DF3BEE|nr:hypothetical protein [Thermoleptolyngbya sp. M55_K2018_002]
MNVKGQFALMVTSLTAGMLLGMNLGRAIASNMHRDTPHSVPESIPESVHNAHEQTSQFQPQFQRIEQPLWAKIAVTTGGLGLVGLELWWFLLSQPRASRAASQNRRTE